MKKLTLSTLLVLLMASVGVQAQEMTKEEKKEWKKKMKKLSLEEYKKMVESQEELQNQVTEANNKAAELEAEVHEKEDKIAQLKTKIEDLEATSGQPAATGGESDGNASTGGTTGGKSRAIPGLVFKVQIGAFKGVDLKKYFGNSPNFSGEVDSDGTMKYTIGIFTEYWEADKFKKALREMGVTGAWIVAYKDGKRIPMEDALEGAVN